MGAYEEDSSRLRNLGGGGGGFKLVTNLKETKEAKCNVWKKTNRYRNCGISNSSICLNEREKF